MSDEPLATPSGRTDEQTIVIGSAVAGVARLLQLLNVRPPLSRRPHSALLIDVCTLHASV